MKKEPKTINSMQLGTAYLLKVFLLFLRKINFFFICNGICIKGIAGGALNIIDFFHLKI